MKWDVEPDVASATAAARFIQRSIETNGSVILSPQSAVTLATTFLYLIELGEVPQCPA
jgi:hypothetical protein